MGFGHFPVEEEKSPPDHGVMGNLLQSNTHMR